VEDPAAVTGGLEERQAAFRAALRILSGRIEFFINLPLKKLDRLALQERLAGIGMS
jgi:arsenate reductase